MRPTGADPAPRATTRRADAPEGPSCRFCHRPMRTPVAPPDTKRTQGPCNTSEARRWPRTNRLRTCYSAVVVVVSPAVPRHLAVQPGVHDANPAKRLRSHNRHVEGRVATLGYGTWHIPSLMCTLALSPASKTRKTRAAAVARHARNRGTRRVRPATAAPALLQAYLLRHPAANQFPVTS